jgi:hypothetical protein
MVNLQKLWVSAQARNASSRPTENPAAAPSVSAINEHKLLELVDDLSEVACAYLFKAGRTIVEKRIKELGGPSELHDDAKRALFLAQVEADAIDSDSHTRIDEMIDLMNSEIVGRFAV